MALAALPGATITSAPFVPLTTTWSAAPSPAPPVAEIDLDSSRPVPDRSLTVTTSAPPSALNVDRLDASVSMTMAATSRVKRSRPPLAERSIFSATLAPLKQHRVGAACPSIVSLPSPGSHWNVSSPAPSSAKSSPRLPSIEVVAVAADERVDAVVAVDRVVAGAAVDPERRPACDCCAAPAITSLPPRPLTNSWSAAVVGTETSAGRPVDEQARRVPASVERVVALGPGDRDAVVAGERVDRQPVDAGSALRTETVAARPFTLATPVAVATLTCRRRRCPRRSLVGGRRRRRRRCEVDVHLRDVGAGEVVHGDVSAPPSVLTSTGSTSFVSIVMVATSRVKPQPAAVRREVDLLGDVGAVEAASCRCRPGPRPCRCRRRDPTGTCRRRRP